MKQSLVASALITGLVVVGGAVSGCAASSSGAGATAATGTTAAATTSSGEGGASGQAVGFAPVLASVPPTARPSAHPSARATPTATPASSTPAAGSHGSGGSGPGSGSGSGGSGSGTGSGSGSGSGSAGGSATCTHPSFTTSDQQGGETFGDYYVTNDMWNAGGYSVSQTMHACSASDWYVTATMNNNRGDGAVKTYPNAHRDFSSGPSLSSFHSITSSFAQSSNPSGIYEYAYDVWINGLATSSSTEVMIWTDNHGQVPSGDKVGTITVSGQSFAVWRSGSYIAFVASSNVSSGSLDLLQFFNWIVSKGWLTSGASLNQVDYGVELVSTGGVPETFAVTNFSVATS